jgi:TetR/AcrR family transcriptional regulator, regulator of cefoperazone and chloramphenicol sensitivity
MNNIKQHSTKDRILNATLNIISNDGFQHVTIRKIAQTANVNIAAINYHFGSKDAVINEALEYLMVQAKKIFDHLKDINTPPKLRLKNFLENYSKSLETYPDQIKNLIYQSIYEKNSSRNTYQDYLKTEGIFLIRKTIQELSPNDTDSVLTLKSIQLLSCLSFPILLGKRGCEIFNMDITQPELRTLYIQLIINNMIK